MDNILMSLSDWIKEFIEKTVNKLVQMKLDELNAELWTREKVAETHNMNRIKELRKEKGLTQQDLAEEIYVHYRTIQRWENEHKIALDQAQLLADHFDVSVAYLLGYSDTTKDNKDFITISVKEYNELKNRSDALDGIIETLKDKKCESYF
ncbi:hypothetical protein VB13_06295 [Streptococcus pyogenes]|nr:hypothetical protein VB13_06295 [Streptococcus pyogenes]